MSFLDRGSSPLARGLRLPVLDNPGESGIIPARAGFTGSGSGGSTTTGDHPRSRGVYATSAATFYSRLGSSPLARGLRFGRVHDDGFGRIIPARAGFTHGGHLGHHGAPDHPRSRGVYRTARSTGACPAGSSPLARGLRMGRPRALTCKRIIPARAGFTFHVKRASTYPRDHPRSRGVYGPQLIGGHAQLGSSPLARGLPCYTHCALAHTRIIPARAGFTIMPLIGTFSYGDHPRSRGVYRRRGIAVVLVTGSSPLARGLPKLS